MTEQELLEQIRRDIDTMVVTRYKVVHQVDVDTETAQHILTRFKQAGYARLANDQSLPELYPEVFAEGLRLPSAQELQRYKKAMEWLIHEAGWRKVETMEVK